MNGDGLADLITASESDGRLVWYQNLGLGQFPAGVEISRDESNLANVEIVDLDGDGDMDVLPIATVASNQEAFVWFENEGAGTFIRSHLLLTPAVAGSHTTVRDWDSDGDLDLLVCGFGSVMAYLGDGAGGFEAGQQVVTAPNNTHTPEWGDLNGDGLEDLLFDTANSGPGIATGQVIFLPQLPSGAFDLPVVIDADAQAHHPTVPIDLNGDGKLDVVRGNDTVDIYVNQGSGVFSNSPLSLGDVQGLRRLLLHDVDGDGDQDLFFSQYNFPNEIRLGELINNQDGTLTLGHTLPVEHWYPSLKTLADLDGNGTSDLVWSSSYSREDRLLWNRTDITGAILASNEVTDLAIGYVRAGDFNGDGLLDVISLLNQGGGAKLFSQSLDDRFERSVSIPGINYYFTQVADLDQDDFTDLIVSESDATHSSMYLLPGTPSGLGTRRPIAQTTLPRRFLRAFPADVDGDGDLDVVAVHTPSDLVFIENLGNGSWGSPAIVGSLPQPGIQEVRDLDGDGLPDILSLGSTGVPHGTHVFRNLGNGAFAPGMDLDATFDQLYRAFSLDLNGDGLRDIVRLSFMGPSGRLYVYMQSPGFQFSPYTQLLSLTGDNPHYEFAAVDWNADGLEDLLVLDGLNSRLTWGRNMGNSQLAPQQTLTNRMEWAESMEVLDFDGDMDLDVIIGTARTQDIRLFLNTRLVGHSECDSYPNSTGEMATLTVSGSVFASANRLRLTARGMPLNQMGFFVIGASANNVPFAGGGDGVLCLGGALGRYNASDQLRSSGNNGIFGINLDLTVAPSPFVAFAILAGQTWHFQGWYRDNNPNPTANFTNSVRVEFR